MKKQSKKLTLDKYRLPPKGDRQRDYVGGLLETVQSDFRVFGETMRGIDRRLKDVEKTNNATFEELGKFKIEMASFRGETQKSFGEIKKEIKSIKTELKDIKAEITKKADLAEVEILEARIINIEKFLKTKGLSLA